VSAALRRILRGGAGNSMSWTLEASSQHRRLIALSLCSSNTGCSYLIGICARSSGNVNVTLTQPCCQGSADRRLGSKYVDSAVVVGESQFVG
jgi:hypothetical protein